MKSVKKFWWYVEIGGYVCGEFSVSHQMFFGTVDQAAACFQEDLDDQPSKHEYGTAEYWMDQIQNCIVTCLNPDGTKDEFGNMAAHPWEALDSQDPKFDNRAEQMVRIVGLNRKLKEVNQNAPKREESQVS